jgi:hypothetical protein
MSWLVSQFPGIPQLFVSQVLMGLVEECLGVEGHMGLAQVQLRGPVDYATSRDTELPQEEITIPSIVGKILRSSA